MSLSSFSFPCSLYIPAANASMDNDNAIVGMVHSACKRIKDNFVLPNSIPAVTLQHGVPRALLQGAGSAFDISLTADVEGGFPTGVYYASIKFPGDLSWSKVTNGSGVDIYELIELIKQAEQDKIEEWING